MLCLKMQHFFVDPATLKMGHASSSKHNYPIYLHELSSLFIFCGRFLDNCQKWINSGPVMSLEGSWMLCNQCTGNDNQLIVQTWPVRSKVITSLLHLLPFAVVTLPLYVKPIDVNCSQVKTTCHQEAAVSVWFNRITLPTGLRGQTWMEGAPSTCGRFNSYVLIAVESLGTQNVRWPTVNVFNVIDKQAVHLNTTGENKAMFNFKGLKEWIEISYCGGLKSLVYVSM